MILQYVPASSCTAISMQQLYIMKRFSDPTATVRCESTTAYPAIRQILSLPPPFTAKLLEDVTMHHKLLCKPYICELPDFKVLFEVKQ